MTNELFSPFSNQNHLFLLLKDADAEDLNILVEYITDKGEGRITLDDAVCKRLVVALRSNVYNEGDRLLIAHEICRFGGNTVANLVRDARSALMFSALDRFLPDMAPSVEYREVVADVATHLKVAIHKDTSVPTMEDGILRKILADAYEKMSLEEKKALLDSLNLTDMSLLQPAALAAAIAAGRLAGFATYKLAAIIANAVAKALIGKGLTFAATGTLMRGISVLIGPVGWILTGIWTLADMASPAYRVTVPCVVQLAYMRQKALNKAFVKDCAACGTPNKQEAKFCSACGTAVASQAA